MTTLLAIGDIHLGRPPAAIPDELAGQRHRFGPEAAFSRAIDEAIERKVDAVVLAGDVIERNRDFFVAYGDLKAGIEKLTGASIPVIAVAGNHDTHVLPRLAEEIDELHLLGAGGQWQETRVDDISIVGWSFPEPRVRRSPLDSLSRKRSSRPTIGLLHCDRDQADSRYAPVSSEALDKAPVDAWLLGHIHRPDDLDSDRPIGYLGSLTALRASETGARGPWLIRISSGAIAADQLALAPLRYETVEVDCSRLDDVDRLHGLILETCRERVADILEGDYRPVTLGFRITLTGRTSAYGALEEAVDSLRGDARAWDESGISCFIQKVELATRPRLDLARLARQSDPCGLLARRLIELDEPESEERERLIELGRRQLEPIVEAREFRDLERELDDDEIVAWLKRSGLAALNRLLEQRGSGQ
ncbi:MAG: metallophosphoesterase [Wenzhouxiangella sp.]